MTFDILMNPACEESIFFFEETTRIFKDYPAHSLSNIVKF